MARLRALRGLLDGQADKLDATLERHADNTFFMRRQGIDIVLAVNALIREAQENEGNLGWDIFIRDCCNLKIEVGRDLFHLDLVHLAGGQ